MASAAGIRWEELADEVLMAVRWAQAMEVADVGTRTLLAGMIREEGSGVQTMA